jgi:hypothetical protein
MGKRKQFRNPPLVEVFTEFFFEPNPEREPHSLLVGKFWGKVKEDFPQPIEPTGPPAPRDRFASADGKTILQIGENLLVVNQLPSYYGWEWYGDRIRCQPDKVSGPFSEWKRVLTPYPVLHLIRSLSGRDHALKGH